MLKNNLSYHPYKRQMVQESKETNFAKWKDFCKQFLYLQLLEVAELSFFSDEAYFKLNECVNKQNKRYWLADNPN